MNRIFEEIKGNGRTVRSGRRRTILKQKLAYKIEILLLVEKYQEKDKNIGLSPTGCYQLLRERLGVNISKTMFQKCIKELWKKDECIELVGNAFKAYGERFHYEINENAEIFINYLHRFDDSLHNLLKIQNHISKYITD